MSMPRVIISGGGTGGHIFPAISIAQEIKQRYPNAEILFVGAKDKMEMEKVPQAGFPIEGLWIAGIQRKINFQNLLFPIKLVVSLLKAKQIIKKFKPNIAIGTGGFASGPLLKMANSMNLPTLLQEQNSFAGVTNKWLAKDANSICVAYKGMEKFFPDQKIRITGNPIRSKILAVQDYTEKNAQQEAKKQFDLDSESPVLLVIGGSLGARRINQLLASKLDFIKENNVQILWQTGKFYIDEYKNLETKQVKVSAFIMNMEKAYQAADFIISRSGAGAVSELCVVGKPVIFIPSPNVAEDHQTKNAHSIVNENGAICITENDLEDAFKTEFKALINDLEKQKKLSSNIKKMAKPKATSHIVDEVEKHWNFKL